MMAKLMIDSAVLWVKHYGIDSYRFDLMGHQPRAEMEKLQAAVDAASGRRIHLIGEGWNFGEIENGRRFEQASQLSLNGSGIGTFNDRLRDAVRGGAFNDSGETLLKRRGFINGGADDAARPLAERLTDADWVRAGIAGSVASYVLRGQPLANVNYRGSPAGYVSSPQEVVNYVENHDNQTLYDMNVFRLPLNTPPMERARVQTLGIAITALAQGVPYFHGGIDILRSKSLDGNSYDAGDAFNFMDWSLTRNGFTANLPRKQDNQHNWDSMRARLTNTALAATPEAIRATHSAFLDWLAVRASNPLFRLSHAHHIEQRLRFIEPDTKTAAQLIAYTLDGTGLANSPYRFALVVVNPTIQEQVLELPTAQLEGLALHPALRDARTREAARVDASTGKVRVPARTAVVWVR
jgi:pullulanase-type alpha-1,6-glucosidase